MSPKFFCFEQFVFVIGVWLENISSWIFFLLSLLSHWKLTKTHSVHFSMRNFKSIEEWTQICTPWHVRVLHSNKLEFSYDQPFQSALFSRIEKFPQECFQNSKTNWKVTENFEIIFDSPSFKSLIVFCQLLITKEFGFV